ncbi:MAG: SDR family NAD(P)-dependent oxidoreductase, partial [Chitinophagia bacterium]
MNIIITGASKGIGFAIANAFAAAGHNLFLTSKTPADLSSAAASLQKRYPTVKVDFVHADLSNQAQ